MFVSCCPSGEPTNDPNVQGDPFKTLFVGRVVSSFYSGLWKLWWWALIRTVCSPVQTSPLSLPPFLCLLSLIELWYVRVQTSERVWTVWPHQEGTLLFQLHAQLYLYIVWSCHCVHIDSIPSLPSPFSPSPITPTHLSPYTHLCTQIHMVANTKTGKPRGYAFLEYEKERDMHGKQYDLPY